MPPSLKAPRWLARATLFLGLLPGIAPVQAYVTVITPGTRALFLQVGTGTMIGANFSSGGIPGNNTTINEVTVTVPTASVGSGAPFAMSTNSTVTNSPLDSFAFCTSPATTGQVYVGGFYRVPGTTGNQAVLSVTAPPNLTNANGDTLSFSTIAWTSTGNSDATPTIPSDSFNGTGAAKTLLAVTRNTWFESCLAFRYLNTQLVPGGTYSGRAVYTLSAP